MDSEPELKHEILRMLHHRWTRHRAYLLRESGYTWVEIAVVLNLHETTVRKYYQEGEKEAEFQGTLHYFLSVRSRKWLISQGIDPKAADAPSLAEKLVRRPLRRVRRMPGYGAGRITRDEILDAVDLIRVVGARAGS